MAASSSRSIKLKIFAFSIVSLYHITNQKGFFFLKAANCFQLMTWENAYNKLSQKERTSISS